MAGIVVQTRNPLAPWKDREITRVDHEISIADWLDENGVQFNAPTVCLKNGEAVLRGDWGYQTIANGDIVTFVELPQGGRNGSGVLQIVLMLVVIVAAVFTGGAVAGAYGAAAGALAQGAVMAVGSMLISMLIPPANGLSSLQNNQLSAPSPTYSLQAQGNAARLGASIPVIYGLHRVYPDFAAQPYTEYAGNEQYLYQLLCVGQGEYDILDLRIEDSPISSFEEISYVKYEPNQDVTAFPSRVEVSGEVAGQELFTGAPIGHFFANADGTEINQIGIDIVAPSGMYYANDAGGLESRNAVFQVEAALWNVSTGTLGSFLVMLTETLAANSPTAIRKSYKIPVPSGRYAVKVTRINAKDESARAGNSIVWAGMRGYIPGQQNYGGVTLLAMIMKATNNLSQTSSRRVNCKVQRKLKTWDPVNGWSATATATRSIAWACADIAKADYGLKLRDNQLDLQGIYALDQQYQARTAAFGTVNGDYCDIVVDNKVSAWDALLNIAQCGRAMPVLQGSILRMVRDNPQAIATAMFCARNIVKGTFNINYLMPGEQSADAVIIEWTDKNTLLPQETLCKLPGSTETNPARVKMLGISSQAQAWREGMTLAAVNRYRRKQITFQTELEGHIPLVGDLIAISHPMPNWGISGELESIAGLDLTLSEPVAFIVGSDHFIALRKQDGSMAGPYACAAHISGDPHKVSLATGTVLGFTPTVTDNKEHTYFAFGASGEMYLLAKVLPPIRPRGSNVVEISCVNEHDAVYAAESGTIPALPEPWQLPNKITQPVIDRLDITQAGTASNPILLLSWPPAPNAEHYLIQTSLDNANWLSHPDTTSTSYSMAVDPGTVYVRVAGVGLARGPWVSAAITTGIIPPPGDVTGLASTEAFTGTQARFSWSPVKRADYYKVEVWALGVLRSTSTQTATAYSYSAEDVLRDGGPWRSLTFKVWAGNPQGESSNPAEITLSNPQVGLLSGIGVYAGIKSVVIDYNRPSDRDFAGVIVCMDVNPGFTPDGTNIFYDGSDSVITIPGLTEGVTYYFNVAGYDSFGKDSLTYAGEFSATISSANVPTPEEIKDGLQTALNTSQTPLSFDADTFAINLTGVSTPVFIAGAINGNPAILLDANVGVTGSISADQISAGRIASTENITIGNGGAVIDGNGAFFVYDGADTVENRDYAVLTAGTLTFQRYRDGAYHEYKSVKRTEYGEAASGSTVQIPGYWESQPKIIVSPSSLQSYNETKKTQSQTWTIAAINLIENPAGSGKWEFDAIAELNYSENSGSQPVGYTTGTTSSDSWSSNEIILPDNTTTITVSVNFSSIRGAGTTSYAWAYRSVQCKIWGWNGVGWVELASNTRNISNTEHGVSLTITIPANVTGYSKIYCSFLAYNTGGGYGSNPVYYGQDSVPSNGNTASVIGNNTGTHTLSAQSYSPPGGWTVYAVNYYVEWRHDHPLFSGSSLAYSNSNYIYHQAYSPYNTVDWTGLWTGDISTSAYNSEFWNIYMSSSGLPAPQYASASLRNAQAVVSRYYVSSQPETSSNSFTVSSYLWAVSGSSAIATGSLNWQAIGE